MTSSELVSISVVSHGQGKLVRQFLHDVQGWPQCDIELIVTLNILEDDAFLSVFPKLKIKTIRNAEAKGFGANHNQAFRAAEGGIFVVANPDIRAPLLNMLPLLDTVSEPETGVCAPLVLSVEGRIEDSARRFPTFARLATRVFLRRRTADYDVSRGPVTVDWVAGMFMVFRRDVFERVGGFDERYHMYMEDADICRRLGHLGFRATLDARCSVVHDAQRASHRNLKYLLWHLRSAARFLLRI